jgi:Predicted oxidoreductases (related to aryl-alcohol dehydrogenases)
MKYGKLSEISLPKIAFGTWSWGSGMNGGNMIFGNKVDVKEMKNSFDLAVNNGFVFWDTAPVYGMGTAETYLADCANNNPNIIYSTKFMPAIFQPSKAMEASIDESLQRLRINTADIFWIHRPAAIEKWTKVLIPLVHKQKIKYVGLSNHTLSQLKQAQQILAAADIPLSAVQNHYSLLYRASEKANILKWCQENEVVFFSYMVLEQGVLTGVYNPENPFPRFSMRGITYPKRKLRKIVPLHQKIAELAQKYNVESAAVVIAWAIQKGTIPLLGVTKAKHINAAIQANKLTLTIEEIQLLEKIADNLDISAKGIWEPKM